MWVQRTWGSGSLLRPAAAVSAHMLPFAWLPPQVPLSPVRKTASTAESHRPRSLGGGGCSSREGLLHIRGANEHSHLECNVLAG